MNRTASPVVRAVSVVAFLALAVVAPVSASAASAPREGGDDDASASRDKRPPCNDGLHHGARCNGSDCCSRYSCQATNNNVWRCL